VACRKFVGMSRLPNLVTSTVDERARIGMLVAVSTTGPGRVSLKSHGVVGTQAMIWAWRHSWCELESTSVPAAV
jgi:hypothetical protein